LKDKKVLITGATGFIGSAIADKLEKEYQVVRTTRVKAQAIGENMLYLDLSMPETIFGLDRTHCFDVIVHFGAQIGWSDNDKKKMLISNVVSTALLANQAEKMNAKFIFASAAIVCGTSTEYIDDDSPINTDTFYGKSKWMAEELVRMSGVRYCILRIGGVFGLNGPSHLGLNCAITSVLNKTKPTLYGSGNVQRNYIYLWDVVTFVEYAIHQNIQGTHLLAGSENITVHTMIDIVCQVLNPNIDPDKQPGNGAKHQLIKSSVDFPNAKSFKTALQDIKTRVSTN